MKLSIAFFAAVSAVPSDFPLPEECDVLQEVGGFLGFNNVVNCWFAYPNPSVYAAASNNTFGGPQEPDTGYGNCGFQYKGESMTNATCIGFEPIPDTFNDGTYGTNLNWMIGNAAFVAKGPGSNNEIVGLDMSGDLNIIQSWVVPQADADRINDEEAAFYAQKSALLADQQNITGGEYDGDFPFVAKSYEGCNVYNIDFTPPSCTYNPDGYYSDYAIMITNQHVPDDNNNYAIANYGGKDNVFTVTLNLACDGATPHDANQAEIVMTNKDICQFVVTVLKGQAQLFYFTISGANEPVDFLSPFVTIV